MRGSKFSVRWVKKVSGFGGFPGGSLSPWWGAMRGGSKSFAFAARLLPPGARDDATVIYAWCRRADDAVDDRPTGEAARGLLQLERELAAVYGDAAPEDPLLRDLRRLFQIRGIPRAYPAGLVEGMRMDVEGRGYGSLEELLHYCFRVAGTVGLMMAHVMDAPAHALPHAARMGMAMQLTNICRDVLEDWRMGRLYLPASWLAEEGAGGLQARLGGGDLPPAMRPAVGRVVRRLLCEAERYYCAGDEGLRALSPRFAFAIHTARLVYSAIGDEIAGRGYDVTAGRAVVPTGRKLALAGRAAGRTLRRAPGSQAACSPAPNAVIRAEDTLLPAC